MLAASEKALGEKQPEAQSFELGAQSDLSRAAKKAGVPLRQFIRQLATAALERGVATHYPKLAPTKERVAKLRAKAAAKGKAYRVGKKSKKK
jgi:hypothetical protein